MAEFLSEHDRTIAIDIGTHASQQAMETIFRTIDTIGDDRMESVKGMAVAIAFGVTKARMEHVIETMPNGNSNVQALIKETAECVIAQYQKKAARG